MNSAASRSLALSPLSQQTHPVYTPKYEYRSTSGSRGVPGKARQTRRLEISPVQQGRAGLAGDLRCGLCFPGAGARLCLLVADAHRPPSQECCEKAKDFEKVPGKQVSVTLGRRIGGVGCSLFSACYASPRSVCSTPLSLG